MAGALIYKLGIVESDVFDPVAWETGNRESHLRVRGKSKARDKQEGNPEAKVLGPLVPKVQLELS